jgi:D-alanyl-D-alanine carboxypeptidase/D-alanyl-D-alanine-endopeptidase (penicillin-binding protein 4)
LKGADVAKGEERHPPRRRRRSWLPDLGVLLVVALAFAAVQYNLGGRLFGWNPVDPATNPAAVQPPQGLRLQPQAEAAPVADAAADGSAVAAKVAKAVAPYVTDPRLGRHVDVLVARLSDGKVVYRHGAGDTMPASTMKLLTTTAALQSLGPMARFSTTVGRIPDTRQIVLVGGGDPFLMSSPAKAKGLYPARADIVTLARRAAASLKQQGLTRVRLGYDNSLFSGPATNPTWPSSYADVVPPISALWVDEGHNPDGAGFLKDPAAQAAQDFRQALIASGIQVPLPALARTEPAGAMPLAKVESAPLGEIIQQTLDVSDNTAAEVIGHHVGLTEGYPGSFAGGVRAVRRVLGTLGIDTTADRMYDGSGLSRSDRLDPQTLIDVLLHAASTDHPELREVITGLPVAGFTGSLQYRFDEGAAAGRGRVRAKTGTLTGVNGLAGVATDLDGDGLVFVAIADRVSEPDTTLARDALDKLAAALGACHCGASIP